MALNTDFPICLPWHTVPVVLLQLSCTEKYKIMGFLQSTLLALMSAYSEVKSLGLLPITFVWGVAYHFRYIKLVAHVSDAFTWQHPDSMDVVYTV